MTHDCHLTSKVLMFEKSDFHSRQLLNLFDGDQNIIPIRAKTYKNLQSLLKKNIDLGGIFIGGNVGKGKRGGLSKIVNEVHYLRPELPIFVRSNGFDAAMEPEICDNDDCVLYDVENPERLLEQINQYIFNISYPNELVRGIQDVSQEVLADLLTHRDPHYEINCSTPYLIRDRFIEGGCMSLMQLVSNWCNGYMILELHDHDPNMLPGNHFGIYDRQTEIHGVNNMLSEITDSIWSGIKERFINEHIMFNNKMAQVPIVINYDHHHLSFGSTCPQLCYRYVIDNLREDDRVFELSQKFVFHLNWSPEYFNVQTNMFDNMVHTGEIELVQA